MPKRYSRLKRAQKKKNILSALIFFLLSIGMVILLIFVGLPLLIKYTSFVSDIKKSSEPIAREDTTPPPPPRIDPIPDYVNELELKVSGSSEPGSTIRVLYNSNDKDVLANSEGSFTTTVNLKKGENRISFQAIDTSGNESQKTRQYSVTYDNEPPELTIISPEDGKTFYGNSQRKLNISGSSDENTKVYINDRIVVVDDSGNFIYTTSLSEGENVFKIVAEDEAGNQQEQSLTVNYSP